MATSNYISAEFTAEQEAAAMTKLNELEAQLAFLVDLNPATLRRIARAGDRSQAFVQRALNLAAESPEILPGEFDLAEFRRDVALAEALTRLQASITRLQERVRTSIVAAKADAFAQALEVYNRSKRTRRAGFEELTRELGRRFRRRASGTNGTPSPEPAA